MLKTTIIVLGIIVLVLLGLLIFWNPVQGPTIPSQRTLLPQSSSTAATSTR